MTTEMIIDLQNQIHIKQTATKGMEQVIEINTALQRVTATSMRSVLQTGTRTSRLTQDIVLRLDIVIKIVILDTVNQNPEAEIHDHQTAEIAADLPDMPTGVRHLAAPVTIKPPA